MDFSKRPILVTQETHFPVTHLFRLLIIGILCALLLAACGKKNTGPYSVGGTVSGLDGTVTLENNGSDSLVVEADGTFTFTIPIADGAGYDITVATQPYWQACTVTGGNGTVSGVNVADVTVECLPDIDIELVSKTADGTLWDGDSWAGGFSSDGRFMVFSSDATNLIAGDTNGVGDVFIMDRTTGGIERVSVAADGSHGDGTSYAPTISGDGRYVAYTSEATNLVPGDTNGAVDIFLYDTQTGSVVKVTTAPDGSPAEYPVFVWPDHFYWLHVSYLDHDGQNLVFSSGARNLIVGDTNETMDVFLFELGSGTISLISEATGGGVGNDLSGGPCISEDGRYVTFHSAATDIIADDSNGFSDVFVKDMQTGVTQIVSVTSDGTQGNRPANNFPSRSPMSNDGRYIVFNSTATNFELGYIGESNTYVRDRVTGETERASISSDDGGYGMGAWDGEISGDGRYVAFSTWYFDDSDRYFDVYVRDRVAEKTRLISVSNEGVEGDGWNVSHVFVGNTGAVAFTSEATTLTPDGGNGFWQIYIATLPL